MYAAAWVVTNIYCAPDCIANTHGRENNKENRVFTINLLFASSTKYYEYKH